MDVIEEYQNKEIHDSELIDRLANVLHNDPNLIKKLKLSSREKLSIELFDFYPELFKEIYSLNYFIIDDYTIKKFYHYFENKAFERLQELLEITGPEITKKYSLINKNYVTINIFDKDIHFRHDSPIIKIARYWNIPEEPILENNSILNNYLEEYQRNSQPFNSPLRNDFVGKLSKIGIDSIINSIQDEGYEFINSVFLRGVGSDEISNLSIGDIISDQGFMSKTTDFNIAKYFTDHYGGLGRRKFSKTRINCCYYLIFYPGHSVHFSFVNYTHLNQKEFISFPGERFKVVDVGYLDTLTSIYFLEWIGYIPQFTINPIVDEAIDIIENNPRQEGDAYYILPNSSKKENAILILPDEKAKYCKYCPEVSEIYFKKLFSWGMYKKVILLPEFIKIFSFPLIRAISVEDGIEIEHTYDLKDRESKKKFIFLYTQLKFIKIINYDLPIEIWSR